MIPTNAENWRVTLKLKANARCRIEGNCMVETDGITAEIQRGADGTLSGIVLSCNTKKEHLPILSARSIHEPDDPNCNNLMDAALRFEGLLGPFGMVEIEFSNWEWAWHYSVPGTDKPILYFSYSSSSEEIPSRVEPMGVGLLSELTKIALLKNSAGDALTLTLYREGENHFHNYRYIEAIRAYYLSIEHEFAKGKTGIKNTLKALRDSDDLRIAYNEANRIVGKAVTNGDISLDIANSLYFETSFEDLVAWLYFTRGDLFHQKSKQKHSMKWNPSHNIPHKQRAIIFRAICASMSQNLVQKLFRKDT